MLIELLREAAEAVPDQAVVQSAARSMSYAECVTRSEALARALDERALRRFACVVDDVAELVALLCASSAVGSEACVYPDRLDDGGIDEYASAFDHTTVVANRRLVLDAAQTVSLDDLSSAHDRALPAPARSAPLLILTTGTTGRPKGARYDWSRLTAALHLSRRPGGRWLLAYNLSQFAGLQVVLHALATRATVVVPASSQPRDALAALRDLGVTHASGTPTFWRLVTHMVDDATAAAWPIEQITLGGEPATAALLADLRRLFPKARVSQVYASTEFGSTVSVRDGRSGLPLSVLDRDVDAAVRLRIVDGELYAWSRVGMLGYHGQEEAEQGWIPTGDLVEVHDDRIRFVGRASEIINVGGVKVHPLPVEERANQVDGVVIAHAYGRGNPVTGQIVALDVVARPGVDTAGLDDAIRDACISLPPAARPRRITFVSDIGVRGDKIARGPSGADR